MATRSRIGLELADDAILSVYHHWDGYPQWLGVTLNKEFNTREKIAEVIDGGDISCIKSDTDWDRNQLDEEIVLYYNDRGEDTEPRLDLSFEDYAYNPQNDAEYLYVFNLDHEWVCYELPYEGKPRVVEIPAEYPERVAA